MTTDTRPYALSIAGFDPSGGAGLLADVKTFEYLGVYGFGVVSALTFQNDIAFNAVNWVTPEKIIEQIAVLQKRFEIKYFKIGIIENMQVLKTLITFLHSSTKDPVIIFDPILKASAGFQFHSADCNMASEILKGIYCITPNLPEAESLFGEGCRNRFEQISTTINVYLKGGHAADNLVTDELYSLGNKIAYTHPRLINGAKHGSGCVLSAALTAQLALGNNLNTAAQNAFNYTYQFLSSNNTLLGYHSKIEKHEKN